nr:uncharacterized protein LOC105964676 [Ipomoea trifida]
MFFFRAVSHAAVVAEPCGRVHQPVVNSGGFSPAGVRMALTEHPPPLGGNGRAQRCVPLRPPSSGANRRQQQRASILDSNIGLLPRQCRRRRQQRLGRAERQCFPDGGSGGQHAEIDSDHKVTLAVNQPLASPSPPKFTVSYHERNWTLEYDIPPFKVWTLQPGLKHEPSTDILPTLGSRIIDDEVKWGKDIDFEGEFIYMPGYWEWAEDALNFFRKPLREGMIYDDVFASLFTYDRNVDIVQAFCEAWCPRTNTLITSSGEISISL